MLRKTENDVLVHIQVVQEMGTVVIAYNIIGNIKNCRDVFFHLIPKKRMTGLLKLL